MGDKKVLSRVLHSLLVGIRSVSQSKLLNWQKKSSRLMCGGGRPRWVTRTHRRAFGFSPRTRSCAHRRVRLPRGAVDPGAASAWRVWVAMDGVSAMGVVAPTRFDVARGVPSRVSFSCGRAGTCARTRGTCLVLNARLRTSNLPSSEVDRVETDLEPGAGKQPTIVRHENTRLNDCGESVGLSEARAFALLGTPPDWCAGSGNPPLCGNFAPVVGECEISNLLVEGAVPKSVRGVFLRNGPNPAFRPKLGPKRYHWFDGDGMVHWVRLGGGGAGGGSETAAGPGEMSTGTGETAVPTGETVAGTDERWATGTASYGRKYVYTNNLKREVSQNKALFTGLRDINPIWSVLLPRLFEKVTLDWKKPDSPFWVVQSKNTANNGLKRHAGRLLATYESGSAYELVLSKELETVGVCDFNGSLSTADFWKDNFTAHAKTCPRTGDLIYMGYNLISTELGGDLGSNSLDVGRNTQQKGKTDVVVGVIDASGTRAERTVVKAERPSMQHDLGITNSRVVLLDGPLVFDLDRVMNGGLPFAFETEQSMRIGILNRTTTETKMDGGSVLWIDTKEPCFAYHVVNCYDDPDGVDVVVIDVCKSDGTNALGMARGFDSDDAGGHLVAGQDSKNGYVGDDAQGDNDDALSSIGAFLSSFSGDKATPQDPRDLARKKAPPLGSHANAAGYGRDVACLWRWKVNVRTKQLTESKRLCTEPSDFPCIDPRRVGMAHQVCYTVGYAEATFPKKRMDVPWFDRVHKHDLETGKLYTYHLEKNRACGDIRFVPDLENENVAGHVLVMTHDVSSDEVEADENLQKAPTELLVLADDRGGDSDAQSDGELRLVARVSIPTRVPFGFHNEFVAAGDLPNGEW